jgi:hypothetical protein
MLRRRRWDVSWRLMRIQKMKVLTGEISYMHLSIFFFIHPYISIYSCDVPFCRIIKAASTRLQLGSSVKRAVRGGGKSKIFPSETRTRTIHIKYLPSYTISFHVCIQNVLLWTYLIMELCSCVQAYNLFLWKRVLICQHLYRWDKEWATIVRDWEKSWLPICLSIDRSKFVMAWIWKDMDLNISV